MNLLSFPSCNITSVPLQYTYIENNILEVRDDPSRKSNTKHPNNGNGKR